MTIKVAIKTYLNILLKSENYLKNSTPDSQQKFEEMFTIFLAPFNEEVESTPPNLQMELKELRSSIELKFLYEGNNIEYYQNLKRLAMRILSVFGTTYSC
ncbi:dimer_Tnp_hAT domain-containing protein [Trichonephila clavipes]|nr:dimer_Tnp_hAT domain-containing protein [Trichonephila clavipes]